MSLTGRTKWIAFCALAAAAASGCKEAETEAVLHRVVAELGQRNQDVAEVSLSGVPAALVEAQAALERIRPDIVLLLGDRYEIIEEGLGGRTTVFDSPLAPARNGSPAKSTRCSTRRRR